MSKRLKPLPPTVRLICCCCGAVTRGRQWHNRDAGFGLCVPCIPFVSRNATPDDLEHSYGVDGINYNVKEEAK